MKILFKSTISAEFFRWFARNKAETVPCQKIYTPGNYVKLQYFTQCIFAKKTPFRNLIPCVENEIKGSPPNYVSNDTVIEIWQID